MDGASPFGDKVLRREARANTRIGCPSANTRFRPRDSPPVSSSVLRPPIT
jgi:hypothetical protein